MYRDWVPWVKALTKENVGLGCVTDTPDDVRAGVQSLAENVYPAKDLKILNCPLDVGSG